MKSAALIRTLVGLLVLALFGWFIWHTRWEDVEIDDPARGLAATDEYYSLRKVLEGAGATLETRTSLEPMPPADATLVLESSLWDIFPERDARLKAWVENGGHLVVTGWKADSDDLNWVPLSFAQPRRRAKPHDEAASDADDADDDDDQAPATRRKPPGNDGERRLKKLLVPEQPWRDCADFEETAATSTPAFEPGRVYRGCSPFAGPLRTLNHVAPTWQLTGVRGTLAMRVAVGRGDVTGVTGMLVTDNHGLLRGDNALIDAAMLQARSGHAIWIIGDEAREPLLQWLWHEARTPFLLAMAAIGLALWRLMVRLGPREAVPPQARRSMGEQVRGTGQFIAGSDPRALHAATRKAFENEARKRVEGWTQLDDADRIAALAATLQPPNFLDQPALLASLNIGGGATPAQILTATAVLEQARRALLHAPAALV